MSWNPSGDQNPNFPRNPYQAPQANPYGGPTGHYGGPGNHGNHAAEKLKLPAIALLIIGGIGLLGSAGYVAVNTFGLFLNPNVLKPPANQAEAVGFWIGAIGVYVYFFLHIISQILVMIGGNCMLKQKSYRWAMVGAVLAVVPLLSPCCILGMPFGIWALVVLSDSQVSQSFR